MEEGWVGGEADQGDVWDSLDVAEGRAGEDEGTGTPLVRDGSALVPSSWQRCVRGRSRGRCLVLRRTRSLCMGEEQLDKSLVLMSPVSGPGSFATYLGRQISWDEDWVSFEEENKYIQCMMNQLRVQGGTYLKML